jgi:hypothetical protein
MAIAIVEEDERRVRKVKVGWWEWLSRAAWYLYSNDSIDGLGT